MSRNSCIDTFMIIHTIVEYSIYILLLSINSEPKYYNNKQNIYIYIYIYIYINNNTYNTYTYNILEYIHYYKEIPYTAIELAVCEL